LAVAGVGSNVGARVGSAVGRGAGSFVGVGVGSAVEANVGFAACLSVGILVGAGVGSTLGRSVGTFVGIRRRHVRPEASAPPWSVQASVHANRPESNGQDACEALQAHPPSIAYDMARHGARTHMATTWQRHLLLSAVRMPCLPPSLPLRSHSSTPPSHLPPPLPRSLQPWLRIRATVLRLRAALSQALAAKLTHCRRSSATGRPRRQALEQIEACDAVRIAPAMQQRQRHSSDSSHTYLRSARRRATC
jgi:hypothetical protein